MSRHGDISFPWADNEGPGEGGAYTFRLGIAEWRKIDERFGIGPMEMLKRLTSGTWRADYPREVIRLGLQAGGSVAKGTAVDDARINRLLRDYCDGRPMLGSVTVAMRICEAALFGPADDTIPKSLAAQETARSSPTGDFPSPPSTDGPESQGSATQSATSTISRSGSLPQSRPDTSSPTERAPA